MGFAWRQVFFSFPRGWKRGSASRCVRTRRRPPSCPGGALAPGGPRAPVPRDGRRPAGRGPHVSSTRCPPRPSRWRSTAAAFELLRSGDADLDAWPADLADVSLAVRVGVADAEVERDRAARGGLPGRAADAASAGPRSSARPATRTGTCEPWSSSSACAPRSEGTRRAMGTEVSITSVEEVRELIEEGARARHRPALAHRGRRRGGRPLRGAAGAAAAGARGARDRGASATAADAGRERREPPPRPVGQGPLERPGPHVPARDRPGPAADGGPGGVARQAHRAPRHGRQGRS